MLTNGKRLAQYRSVASQIVPNLYYCEVVHPMKQVVVHTTAMYDSPSHAYNAAVEWVRHSQSRLAKSLPVMGESNVR